MQHYFNNDDFTCDLDVNMNGHNKVYAAWHVLDQYRGRWGRKSVTRNVVDIIINVPEWNIQVKHHFCFRYFNCSRGSPETLIPHILKRVVSLFYERYYTDNTTQNVTTRRHYCARTVTTLLMKDHLLILKCAYQNGSTWLPMRTAICPVWVYFIVLFVVSFL